jgi:NAD(P)-dependent dehydrogenase (short-subunit alcohol dehydrogenase family)
MASVMATVAYPGSAPYAASKHGVVGLTKAAALEQAKKGVRINAVGPGFIHTPLLDHYDDDTMVQVGNAHPIGRVGKAEEIAETVVFLLSDKASFTTGSYYTVDGGYTAQ